MRIGIDIDNVIADLDKTFLEEFEKEDKNKRNNGIINRKAKHITEGMFDWSSKEIEDYCGNIINGILFMHIPPWEFQYIVDNPIVTKCTGSTKEIMKIGMLNSGLFSTILQRKDIICIACGHSHNDCFEGTFCNVKMCLDACAGYSPYGTDDLRGGRIFEINENDTNDIKTYMVHYKDLK